MTTSPGPREATPIATTGPDSVLDSVSVSVPSTVWRSDSVRTTATFRVRERFGLATVLGRLPVAEAMVTIDTGGLPRGTARLDASGVDTGNARRDKDLRGARFFDTSAFPMLDFRSTSSRRTSEGLVVEGVLSVRGEDCPLALVTTLEHAADGTVVVHASGVFDRMTSPLRKAPRWLVGAEVHVEVDAVLEPGDASA